MKITRLFVSGYKNLIDCEITPNGVHAITGPNGFGKSNLLEVMAFIAGLQSGSDEDRKEILETGFAPNGEWFPISKKKKTLCPFRFEIDCQLKVDDATWVVSYSLELKGKLQSDEPYHHINGAHFSAENVTAKLIGNPGKAMTLLARIDDGRVSAFGGASKRAVRNFKSKANMSALQALEVREADDFVTTYPVLASLRRALLSTQLIRLDSESFRYALHQVRRAPFAENPPGTIINRYDPYYLLREIEKDKKGWEDFCHWLRLIVDVEDLILHEAKDLLPKEQESAQEPAKMIMARQHGRFLMPGELSMGASVIIGYLTVLYTLVRKGGAALFEEPENYLHPKAITELITLFREFSPEHTIIFSTHSPVALNSMKPNEVTVMRPTGDGFVTTQTVSEIKEAVDALNRGYLSFGDLLHTNFAVP